ncbi:hybrid sensory histidine kinase BarA [Shigella sonnei]|nr:hybrid sensory histidine kinase BarA [Shigella sonnei]
MTNYSLRARMMILILAPTVLIGLLLSIFFVVHRYCIAITTCSVNWKMPEPALLSRLQFLLNMA